ncbi:Pantothenate synthetase [compost metagenome]
MTAFLSAEPLARPEVVALRNPDTLETMDAIGDKPVLLLLFVRFGTTKLLDNRVIAAKSARFAKVA